jgi:hypothetical protein
MPENNIFTAELCKIMKMKDIAYSVLSLVKYITVNQMQINVKKH